jgi:hypothetical protein
MGKRMTEHAFQTLAERLCGAYISAQMGFASVDYVVKRYIRPLGKPPSEVWFQIAEFVSEVMAQAKPLPDDDAAGTSTEKSAATPSAPISIQGRLRKRRSKRTPGAEK